MNTKKSSYCGVVFCSLQCIGPDWTAGVYGSMHHRMQNIWMTPNLAPSRGSDILRHSVDREKYLALKVLS